MQRHAIDMDMLAQHVPSGAGNIGDDGRLLLGQGIEQARLARIGPTGDHHVHALTHQRALTGGGTNHGQLCLYLGEHRRHPAVTQEVDLLFGEIDGRLHIDAQLDQTLHQVLDSSREVPLQGAQGIFRRGLGAGIDQVGDRLGLGEVELVVEEGAFGELPRTGGAGPQLEAAAEQQIHDHRTTMPLQLEDILPGEGVWPGEEERDAFIDHAAAASKWSIVRVTRCGAVAHHRLGDRCTERA